MEPQTKTQGKTLDVNLKDAITYGQLIATVHAVFYGVGNTKDSPATVPNPSLSDYEKAIKDACNPTSDKYDLCVYAGFTDDYQLLYNIQMTDFDPLGIFPDATVYYGFVAQHKKTGAYVMAIRGTETAMELNDDIQFLPADFKEGGKVVYGFYKIYGSAKLIVPPDLTNGSPASFQLTDVAKNPSIALKDIGKVPMVVAGHSLGASLATLYAADAGNSHNSGDLIVYTFSSPRVGNQDFVNIYNSGVQENYRIFNKQDDVPNQPEWAMQVDVGYQIDSDNYPDVINSKNCQNDKNKWKGCAHVIPTLLYILEKKAGGNPDPSMLNAENNSCWYKGTK